MINNMKIINNKNEPLPKAVNTNSLLDINKDYSDDMKYISDVIVKTERYSTYVMFAIVLYGLAKYAPWFILPIVVWLAFNALVYVRSRNYIKQRTASYFTELSDDLKRVEDDYKNYLKEHDPAAYDELVKPEWIQTQPTSGSFSLGNEPERGPWS